MPKLPKVHRWFVEPLDSETNTAVSHMLADKGDADRHGHHQVGERKDVPLWEVTEDELRLILSNALNSCNVYHMESRGDDIKKFDAGLLYQVRGVRRSLKNVLVVWTSVPYQMADKMIRHQNLSGNGEFWHRYSRGGHGDFLRRLKDGRFTSVLIFDEDGLGGVHAELIKAAQRHHIPVNAESQVARMFVASCALDLSAA